MRMGNKDAFYSKVKDWFDIFGVSKPCLLFDSFLGAQRLIPEGLGNKERNESKELTRPYLTTF